MRMVVSLILSFVVAGCVSGCVSGSVSGNVSGPSGTASEPSPRTPALASAKPSAVLETPRILFVGNSLTGYNNLPGLVRAMANAGGYHPYVEGFIHYNTTLEVPLADAKFKSDLASRNWDYVVIQDWSDLALRDPAAFASHVTAFAALLKPTKTKLLLFENWPYKNMSDDSMEQIDAAYTVVAARTGARLIAFGRALNDLRSRFVMYAKDDVKHPSPLATYLGAVMFADAIFNIAPRSAWHFGTTVNTPDVVVGEVNAASTVDFDKLYSPNILTAVQNTAAKYH